MNTRFAGGLLSLALVILLVTAAGAAERSDFALFDGTNPANGPAAGAVCFVRDVRPGEAFTYHVAVANFSNEAGEVRITYFDGDFVRFPIAAFGSFSLSQAAGSPGGADRAVRVSNGGSAAKLAGTMSAISERRRPVCLSCDATADGDAACDAVVAD